VGELIARAKREWLQAIDAIPYLVAVCDSHHRISRVNMAMAQKLGVSAGQAIGLVCYERLHEMGKIPRFCPVEPKGEWDGELSVEMWENHFGGRYLVSVSPLCGSEANRVSGCVYVARDVSRAGPENRAEPARGSEILDP
jgi:PAS domain-containing protein